MLPAVDRTPGWLIADPRFTPALHVWPDAGVYQLFVQLRQSVVLRVGSLGWVRFAAGTYIYTGRASRGLRARVLRHLQGGRRRHWHIDYLLAAPAASVVRILLASTDPEDECRVNRTTADKGCIVAPRFGASDCRSGCAAHLWLVRPGDTIRRSAAERARRRRERRPPRRR
jgi:Uri superfamily endonuclease